MEIGKEIGFAMGEAMMLQKFLDAGMDEDTIQRMLNISTKQLRGMLKSLEQNEDSQ